MLHKYVLPPDACNEALCPAQMVAEVAFATGGGFTVTVTVAKDEHPLEPVVVTVYVVFTEGFTVMAAALEPLLHEYVFPPDAMSVAISPVHKIVFPVIAGGGLLFTVTVTLAVSEHPPLLTITE